MKQKNPALEDVKAITGRVGLHLRQWTRRSRLANVFRLFPFRRKPTQNLRESDERVAQAEPETYVVEATVFARIDAFCQAEVTTAHGVHFTITRHTAGVRWQDLAPGQRLLCTVTRRLPRVITAKPIREGSEGAHSLSLEESELKRVDGNRQVTDTNIQRQASFHGPRAVKPGPTANVAVHPAAEELQAAPGRHAENDERRWSRHYKQLWIRASTGLAIVFATLALAILTTH